MGPFSKTNRQGKFIRTDVNSAISLPPHSFVSLLLDMFLHFSFPLFRLLLFDGLLPRFLTVGRLVAGAAARHERCS